MSNEKPNRNIATNRITVRSGTIRAGGNFEYYDGSIKMSIDFSKKPEGATHYSHGTLVNWYRNDRGKWEFFGSEYDGWLDSGNQPEFFGGLIKIPTESFGQYTPETDQERMLCDAVIMKCRGIKVEMKSGDDSGEWVESGSDGVVTYREYRRAPKLPEIPWEWIDGKYDTVEVVSESSVILKGSHSELGAMVCRLKLDLTDVDLPLTVKRPGV